MRGVTGGPLPLIVVDARKRLFHDIPRLLLITRLFHQVNMGKRSRSAAIALLVYDHRSSPDVPLFRL